ncbi:MAG: aspartate carbamoyltransferase regulatory subunit [Bacteroidales bacterium]
MSEKVMINKEKLAVAALQNGTVIDHIPAKSLFKVVNLLGIAGLDNNITIGFNLESKRNCKKGIIKIADILFPTDVLNRIAIIAPNATINIISDYKVVDKHTATLPDEIVGIVKCNNPKCITNNEPMKSRFHLSSDKNEIKCHYCEKTIKMEDIKLV